MLDSVTTNFMLTRFTAITNSLVSLDKPISNDHIIRNIIRALLKSWEVKATTLKELNDKEEMDFTVYMGNLKIHEMEMKSREKREPQKKRDVSFKAFFSKSKEEEEDNENLPND